MHVLHVSAAGLFTCTHVLHVSAAGLSYACTSCISSITYMHVLHVSAAGLFTCTHVLHVSAAGLSYACTSCISSITYMHVLHVSAGGLSHVNMYCMYQQRAYHMYCMHLQWACYMYTCAACISNRPVTCTHVLHRISIARNNSLLSVILIDYLMKQLILLRHTE